MEYHIVGGFEDRMKIGVNSINLITAFEFSKTCVKFDFKACVSALSISAFDFIKCERFGPNCDGNNRVGRGNREFDSRFLKAPKIQFDDCVCIKGDATSQQITIAIDRTTTITILRFAAYKHMI